jgi:hypothetical protein
MAHACLQRSRSLTRADPAEQEVTLQQSGRKLFWASTGRGFRDGMSRGREPGRSDIWRGQVKLFWKNFLMRHGSARSVGIPPLSLTSPSASLRVVRLSVGTTGFEFYPICSRDGRGGRSSGAEAQYFGAGTARVNSCPDTCLDYGHTAWWALLDSGAGPSLTLGMAGREGGSVH